MESFFIAGKVSHEYSKKKGVSDHLRDRKKIARPQRSSGSMDTEPKVAKATMDPPLSLPRTLHLPSLNRQPCPPRPSCLARRGVIRCGSIAPRVPFPCSSIMKNGNSLKRDLEVVKIWLLEKRCERTNERIAGPIF